MIFWKWKKDDDKYNKSYINFKQKKERKEEQKEYTNFSKREDIDSKLLNRSMVAQIGLNPFMQNSSFDVNLSNYDKNMR
jgi:hypothetical protein